MNSNTKNVFKGIYALLLGLLIGILTVMGQKYLPDSLNSLANSGAIWLIPAFFMASTAEKRLPAMILCAETLIVCVISYYWVESIFNQHAFAFGGFYFYLWLICAVIAGIIFGFGANLYRQKSTHYHWGASLLPAVFLAEGLSELIHLSEYMHMIPAVIGRILLGLALYFIIYKKALYQRKSLISLCSYTVLGVAAYELLFKLTT
ncbi:DUF6518 family protein [Caproiciproducens galactitolivorans]|uniref:DUF6518 family protein n=1 Tax=Caproiciproducens galactitolivorans TaxID=642589 RepID=A0ABT4BR50_9FIRM|nr:DUF6518 family protein [Caproiciproducens galactitolivorans]MCY1713280.1 DUF6518 family protein [Caproiciproducens galactitolivorans]